MTLVALARAAPLAAQPTATPADCVQEAMASQWQPEPLGPDRRILRVGPDEQLKLPSQAAAVARDGDVILIAAGDYVGDSAVWTQNRLLIRGEGTRPRLLASGRLVEDKAIWVIKGTDVTIENIEFFGARVPSRNGAGIRAEGEGLTVRASAFLHNEMGILTDNNPDNTLTVEYSEFGYNGITDGSYHHGLYAGRIGRLTVRQSYFHHGLEGHLLKSRAQTSDVLDNRFIDGENGQASYELDFAEGGEVRVSGNLIEQSATSPNEAVISYAAEARGPVAGRLNVECNTIVSLRPDGVFVRNHAQNPGRIAYNEFAGTATIVTSGEIELTGNRLTALDKLCTTVSDDEPPCRTTAAPP